MIEESRISKKGQITIPKNVRAKLGLKAGDIVVFESVEKWILIRKKEDSNIDKIMKETTGIWKNHPQFKNKTTKEIIETIRGPDDETKQQ